MSNQQYYGDSAPSSHGQNTGGQQQYAPPTQQYSQFSGNPYNQQGGNAPPHQQQYAAPTGAPPGHRPPQRTGTDAGLPQGQERSEQLEYMQNYEQHAPKTTADQDQETLRKEYPGIDSSLIAALYSDSEGSLSATREMLQALSSTG